MKSYTVAIIGCGSIGALKDDTYDLLTTDAVLTHANAFSRHPDTEIIAFVDPDIEKAALAMWKWRVPDMYTCTEAMIGFNKICPDIVVVATPTETHYSVLMDVLKMKPKLVVAEKPFCSTLRQAEEVRLAYSFAKIPILIDYIRRFDPIQADIFNGLRDGKYGAIWHARCLYGRGLEHDGCHGLDIFNWIFGAVQSLSYKHHGIEDRSHDDPSYTLRLEYKNCKEVYMVATDSRRWGVFEIEFVTEAGILRLSDWGKTFRHFKTEPEATFGQYHAIAPTAEKIETGLTKALLYMADNAVNHIHNSMPLLCTSADAVAVRGILAGIGGSK